MVFKIQLNISPRKVYDTVVAGIEGGQYSSFTIVAGDWASAWQKADSESAREAFAEIVVADRYELEEWCDGDEEPTRYHLTDARLQAGLDALTAFEPGGATHAADIAHETGDALTGDALLQFACFGELIY